MAEDTSRYQRKNPQKHYENVRDVDLIGLRYLEFNAADNEASILYKELERISLNIFQRVNSTGQTTHGTFSVFPVYTFVIKHSTRNELFNPCLNCI